MNDGHLVVEVHLDAAHHGGDRVAGQVVVGRAEPATDQHGVGVGEQVAEHALDPGCVVADLHLEVRGDAVGRQLLADPRRVGVDDLSEQQLGADG